MVSKILGPDGQPINLEVLHEPQTSRLIQLQHEFQGHPARGLTPSRLSEILVAAERNDLIAQCELFEDMEERDGHIASEMGKRRRAVSMLDFDIIAPANPSPKEKRAAEELKELLNEVPDLEDVFYDLTDAIGKGYACLEIEWHMIDKKWLPKTITHRPQSWFSMHRGYRQEIRLRDISTQGEILNPFGWVTHTHRTKSGYLERAGLFRVLCWPYLFKNYSVGDLAEFLEIYGIPMRIGKYPPGAGEKEKTTLLRALANIGHNAAGIIPEGMALDFHDAATGDPDAFMAMIDWCERTQSKVILGATLTSQADRGSNTNALGNIHNEVRKDLRDSDVKQIASSISRELLYPIAHLNGLAPDGLRRSPRIKFDIAETEDIKIYADALPALVGMGMKIKRKWAQERLGIPEPDDDEDILTQSHNDSAATQQTDKPGIVKATAELPSATESARDVPDAMLNQLDQNLQPAVDAWLNEVRSLLNNSISLEAFRDELINLYPGMSLSEYADAMAQALTAAHLAGRSDAQHSNA